jgi:hypothetical protein
MSAKGKVTASQVVDRLVSLERSTGGVKQVRQSQIDRVVAFIRENPGLTALDISTATHVPVENINWMLDCSAEAQKLAGAGMVARPARGPLPNWAQHVPGKVLPTPTPNALARVSAGGIAELDSTITLPFARQEGEVARSNIVKLMRFSGGSSPARAKRANEIVEMSVSLICLKLQEAVDHFEELKEEAISICTRLESAESRAETAESRAQDLDELVKNLNDQLESLQLQAAIHAAKADALKQRLSLSSTGNATQSPPQI